jgi:putative nucleotidyltransferase-like protein
MRKFGHAPGRGAYWPDGEHELLLQAALLSGTDAIEAWRVLQPRFDAERADRASLRLLPLLGANLRRHGSDDPIMAASERVRQQAASRSRALFDAGRGLLRALTDSGINTLVLKGGALATRLYREAGLRPMSDLDVLVPTDRAEAAVETVRRAGWSPGSGINQAFIRMQHAADVFAEGGSVKCDLHWHVYWECCQPDADDDLWAASVPFDFEGVPTRTLGPADQLLHVCVHGSRRAQRPWFQWVADSLLLLRENGIDWPRFVGEAGRRRFALRAGSMLAYLRETFGAPVPDAVLARLEALPVSRLERLEYWVANRPQGLLGELPNYWCNYRRLREGWPTPPPPGFADYLQQIWRVESLGEVASGALARARERMRAAFRYS